MSREARDRVWDKSKQEGSRLVVMLRLAEWADPNGICFPGDSEVAKKCRMKERNMQYVLKELEGRKEILKIRRPGRGLRSYTLVTVGLSVRRIYTVLRRNDYPDLEIDKSSAKGIINDWLKGAEDCTNSKKVQSDKRCKGAHKRCNPASKKVQSSVEKGAIQRSPYKEEPSGTVMEPSVEPPERTRASRERNPFSDLFCEAYDRAHPESIPYKPKRGDFVQLANLRKEAEESEKNWLTLERFDRAVKNYFASELTQFTLADLCVRFRVFYKGPTDRYNRSPKKNGKEELSDESLLESHEEFVRKVENGEWTNRIPDALAKR